MTSITINRPEPGEYSPYHGAYISLVPEGNIVSTLRQQGDEYVQLFHSIPESKGNSSYQSGKWTIKEVLGHIIDTERIMAYRALRFARNDESPLPGFEQDDYIRFGNFNERTVADLASEFRQVRDANLTMVEHFDQDAWNRAGTASNNRITVRALAYILAGHAAHHVQILRTRYL